jgi:hypothetical protein
MKQKSSFLIYHEYREPLKLLTDEQRGQLLMALIDYSESGVVPELDGISMMAFSFIQSQMDRDSKKYENRCSSNRENGKKGGRPKKENDLEENPKKPLGFEETEKKTKNPKKPIKIKNKDKEKDINKNTMCKSEADALFERVWKLYPQKRGKGKVSDANKRRLLDIGFDELSRAIDRYKADLALDDWRKPQNGSTFFNSGYIDYLDVNYERPERMQSEKAPGKLDCQRDYDFDSLEQQLFEKQFGG